MVVATNDDEEEIEGGGGREKKGREAKCYHQRYLRNDVWFPRGRKIQEPGACGAFNPEADFEVYLPLAKY